MSDGMHKPAWKWEWSPNTVGIVATILTMFVGGGVLWGEMRTQQDYYAQQIMDLRTSIRNLEGDARRLESLEFRIGALEARVGRTADSMQSMMQTLNGLASDVRSVREALERMENARPSSPAGRAIER